MDILLESFSFLWREAGLELREDIDTVLRRKYGYFNGTNDFNTRGKPGAGGYREHDILVIGKNS